MKPRFAIGFVSGADVSIQFFASVVAMFKKEPIEIISLVSGPLLHVTRNDLAAMYLRETHAPTLLMVDTDIEFTGDDVDAIMAHEDPVVSGIYPKQNGDVVSDGCGFLRIDRFVIEKLMPYPFNPIRLDNGVVTGEDVGFRYHAHEAGYPTTVDWNIRVGHVKPQVLRVSADRLVNA